MADKQNYKMSYGKERNLLIVRSSFQFISAILVAHMYSECENVLLLDGSSQFLKIVGNTVAVKMLFDEIVFYSEPKIEQSLIQRCFHRFAMKRGKYKGNSELADIINKKYGRIFYFSLSVDLSIVIGNIQKTYPDTIFCKLEDGLASYVLSDTKKKQRKNRISNILFNQFLERPEKEILYLLFPDLYVGENSYKIKKLEITDEARVRFRNICDEIIEKEQILKENVIFEECLDQFSDPEGYTRLLNNLKEILGENSISVKGHPRNRDNILNVSHLKMEVPWEVYCLSYPEVLKKRKLFSILSTTCYMPHLFGVEDVESFYLYPCYEGDISVRQHKKFNEFMEKLIARCPNIHLIKNLEELK